MILFPKDFPDKLRSSILTSEVVGKKVKLSQRGKDFLGICPFHNEKTPSFTVNDSKGFYHCFGCQEHGDIITFEMKTQGLEFPDAVRQLAEDFGIEIPQVETNFKHSQETQDKLDRDHILAQEICNIFEANLKQSMAEHARIYLDKRGVKQETIDKFHLGFAPDSYDFLNKALQAKGFSEAELAKSGVIALNERGKLYDKMRNRIIFPIFDKKDRAIAFGGRVLGADLPKYLNSAETEIFKKNQTLYNINNARKAIYDQKYAIIVEGYMDAISLDANGIENVVAGLGTALGENHLKELFRITDRVVICLDGDSAGMRAAKRTAEIALPLVSAKKNISFTFLPDGLDPDDFIRNFGKKALENLLTKDSISLSQALFEFALIDLNLGQKDTISPENKAKVEENLLNKLELIKDGLTNKHFKFFFNDALYNLGRKTFKKGQKSSKYDKKTPKTSQNHQNFGQLVKKIYVRTNNNMADHLAKNIIAFIIRHKALANYEDENFNITDLSFASSILTDIKDHVLQIIDENPQINEKNLLLALEKYGHNDYNIDIGQIVEHIMDDDSKPDEGEVNKKMRLLLLKELLHQVEDQYKQALLKIEEIDTCLSEISDEKIKEIFAYKNSLEQKILLLERD